MKKENLVACLLMVLVLFSGCKKVAEGVVDCFGESILTSLHFNVSASNSKQVTTEVRYSGEKSVKSVKWEFGDGSTTTTTGLTTTHTYAAAGSYVIKARVTILKGKSSCEVDPTRTVNIL